MDSLTLNDQDYDSLRVHVSLFNALPCMLCGVKDLNSRYVVVNDQALTLFGYPSLESLRGKDDSALRCPAAEHAETFRQQDRHVIKHRESIPILQILAYADGKCRVAVARKSPFIFNGQLAGVFGQSTEISDQQLSQVATLLQQTDRRYYAKSALGRSYTVGNFIERRGLTMRELDCVFYALRGFTVKESARMMGISQRTVESYLNSIKYKWKCSNKGMIIECAITHGFLNYIPLHVIEAHTGQISLFEDGTST